MKEYQYYVIYKKEKYFFPFCLEGLRDAQAFIRSCGFKKRTIHVVRNGGYGK